MKNPKKRPRGGTADISVPLFKIAARFCAGRERSAIAGVRVQRHPVRGVVLLATDGHRLIILHDEHGRCGRSFTMGAQEGLKRARAMDKSSVREETRWRIGGCKVGKSTARVPLIDETFPDWTRIPARIAATRGGAAQSFNPKYLAAFARVAADLTPGAIPSITLVPGKTMSDPLLVAVSLRIACVRHAHADAYPKQRSDAGVHQCHPAAKQKGLM